MLLARLYSLIGTTAYTAATSCKDIVDTSTSNGCHLQSLSGAYWLALEDDCPHTEETIQASIDKINVYIYSYGFEIKAISTVVILSPCCDNTSWSAWVSVDAEESHDRSIIECICGAHVDCLHVYMYCMKKACIMVRRRSSVHEVLGWLQQTDTYNYNTCHSHQLTLLSWLQTCMHIAS